MDDNEIKKYFGNHKLNGTGIRNFLMYVDGAREFVSHRLEQHPEYETLGGYITCLVNNMPLGKCVVCGKTLGYKSTRNGHTYCSYECFKNDKDAVIKKRSKTCLEKYGVSNPGAHPDVIAKRNATIKERYGVDAILKNKEALDKMKKTMIDKYGVDSYQKTEERKRNEYHQSYQTILGWKDYVIPMFTVEEYHGYKHNEIYMWKCAKCGNEFKAKIGGWGHIDECCKIPRCMNCYPFMTNESNVEKELREFVLSVYQGEVIVHDRSLLNGIEIDLYIPERKIAIEFDGLFFHNEFSGKDSDYHLNKTILCEKNGVKLIHVFEDEWKFKQNIVKDRICGILGIGLKRLLAKECSLKEIDSELSNTFLKENHFQGADDSSIRYGLFNDDGLVSVMTFKSIKDIYDCNWELSRFATKIGYEIVGGAFELLGYFEKKHFGSIVSFADRRYILDDLYEKLGFVCVESISPICWWCKSKKRINDNQMQDDKVCELLGKKFDKNKSKEENLHDNGWSRIYDCGNLIFIKKISK